MNAPLLDIDLPGLAAEVESYEPGQGNAWPTLFPLKYTSKFDIKSLAGKEGVPISADKVAFNVKAPTKTRKTVGAWSGELEKIAISRDQDEIFINGYNDAKVLAAASPYDTAAKQDLVDMVYDDVTFVNTGINTKIEVDALRTASHGFKDYPATIDGDNATQDIINFNIPDENKTGVSGATKKWSAAATADGIGDIIALAKKIRKAGHLRPRFAFMDQAAYDNLCAQKATLERLAAWSVYKSGAVTLTADSINIDNINRYLQEKAKITIVVLDVEAGIEDKAGNVTTIRPWAENVVVLSPTAQLGWTYYKTVPMVKNTDALQTYGAFYKVTRYSELNPMLEVTLAEAYVLCVLINRNSLGYINTEYTSWNNGATE